MKNKNRPKREYKRKFTGYKRQKPFNPWIYKYFKMAESLKEDTDDHEKTEKLSNADK